ncbi:MAG: PadR family transcriptional regulator [Butyricicoccus sp.]
MEKQNDKCACMGSSLMRFVQPILLSLLLEEPCHGYDLVRKISQTELWKDSAPDPTGIYRVLRDMEKRGLISSHLSNSKAGIGKRVFSINEDGVACMVNWIATLRTYRTGISDVISRLETALDCMETLPESGCCTERTEDNFGDSFAPCCCGGENTLV